MARTDESENPLISDPTSSTGALARGNLWYFEEREDVGDWLGRHGWDVTVTPAPELTAGYDRRPPQDIDDATPQTLFVSAQRTGKGE